MTDNPTICIKYCFSNNICTRVRI